MVGWEPVMKSDLGPPSASVQARVSEPTAYRFWDPQHLVSKAILSWVKTQAEAPHEEWEMLDEDEVAWDCILVFPPGARWENEFPKPSFIGLPVVDQIPQSVAALKSHQQTTTVNESP